MNTYYKYQANIYLAKCVQAHNKGEIILVTTKYGKENESIIFNLIFEKDGFYYYSIIRADGFNVQERAKAKSEKYQNWAESAEKKSNQSYEASQEGRDFLSLGEPIKIGHHSENRHRSLIKRNWDRMGKSVELGQKAKSHELKAKYWAEKEDTINISMIESVGFYKYKQEEATEEHRKLKSGELKRSHSYSLTYTKKAVNDFKKLYDLAIKLWC